MASDLLDRLDALLIQGLEPLIHYRGGSITVERAALDNTTESHE